MVNRALAPTLPGQIVRIYLENFMTYDSVEISPGFHLNMVIGPNGTGKSSIACAVVLGLGGRLKALGRADQVGSYVKAGRDQGLVELELYTGAKNNIVIRRQISTNNKSVFFINDEVASAVKVNELRRKFNIQVDNLCTFLPQEKVHEFAKMNPQQLLENTQKTLGSGELLMKHEKLIEMRKDLVQCEKSKQLLEDQLSTETAKNDRLRVKVQSIKEKLALNDKVKDLNQKKSWLLYHEARKEKKDAMNDLKKAEKNVGEKQKLVDSLSKELKDIEQKSLSTRQAFTDAKKDEAGKRSVINDRQERLQQKLDSYTDLDAIYENKIAAEKSKINELRRHKANVDKLTNDLASLSSKAGEEHSLESEHAGFLREQKKARHEEGELRRRTVAVEENRRRIQQELRNVAAEKRLLENRRDIRLNYLKQHDPDAYEAVQWIKHNQHIFQGKIYNPMLLELNVPNPDMAKYVESSIPYHDLFAFTATSGQDMNLLVQKLRVEKKLKISVVTSSPASTQSCLSAELSRGLRSLGFHSFVKDLVIGPEPILNYLCRTYRLNNIPVGDARINDNSDRVPDSIPKFYSDCNSFSTKKSAYSGARSTIVKKLSDPRIFSASGDEGMIEQLACKEQQLSEELENANEGLRQIEVQRERLNTTLDNLATRIRNISSKLEERKQIMEQLAFAKEQVSKTQQNIKQPEELCKEKEREKKFIQEGIERGLLDLKKATEALQAAYVTRSLANFTYLTSTAGIEGVQERLATAREALRVALDASRLVNDALNRLESECTRLRESAKAYTNGHCPGERGFQVYEKKFKTLKDTVAELEAELEETRARADFLDDDNTQVLVEYNNREETIKKLTDDLDKGKRHLTEKLSEIEKTKSQWLEPVKELISQIDKNFGNYFASMCCAGEVCLQIPEDENDFDNFGIKIRVKFRDGVPLQDLSRNFQSGGERAVTTAIYMLSMQNMTSVPFRFVDEINQGMDPENERRIIELIMRLTSPAESSQYFFVTPKLLPKLDCPVNMTVLCVFNGPALKITEFDVGKILRRVEGLEGEEDNSF